MRYFYDMKETLMESAPANSTIAKCRAEFTWGWSLCDDLHWCGRPATSVNEETVQKVNKLVMSDRRLSVRFIATSVGISTGIYILSWQRIWWKWCLHDGSPKCYPTFRRHIRVKASTSLLRLFNKNLDNFFTILMVDESWLYKFHRENKVWSGNMPLLHLPESFVRCCVSSQSYGYGDCILGCWWNCTDLSTATPSQEPTTRVWSEKFGQHW